MNEINNTAVEATTVAAETTVSTVQTILSSKAGRYTALATGLAVTGYLAYLGGKKIGAALAARKAAKATAEAAQPAAEEQPAA